MKIAAILLAAGASTRFGAKNKLLATLGGKPLVRHVAEALAAAGIDDIITVTGPDAAAIAAALAGLPVRFTANPSFADGMGSSIAAGVRALAAGTDGAFVVPGDMPGIDGTLLGRLLAIFAANGGCRAVFPELSDGRQTPPVLWPSAHFAELARLEGAQGGKSLLQRLCGVAVPVANAELLIDIDTRDDLGRAAAKQ